MKFRGLFTACLAGASLLGFAQTHVEGVEYYNADQINNARELLTRNMEKPGTDKAIANYYLGKIAMREGNTAEAKKYFDAGVAANPANAYNYVGLGELLLKSSPKEAQKLFKEAEKLGKKDAALQVDIARAYYDADPVTYEKEIAKRIEKAQKFDMAEPSIYIFEGDRFADKKDWGNAAGQYEMALNYAPDATGAYVKYANMYEQVNPQYSIQMLKNLLTQNPTSALGQRQLANTYYEQENYKEAADAYGKYVNNPNHFKQDEDRYALLLFSDGNYQKGYDYATKLIESNPSNFTAKRFQFMNAAQIEAMQPQLLAMADALNKEHLSNPNNRFAAIDYTLIADEFSKAKRYDEAIAVLNEGIKELPAQKSFGKDLALVYSDMGDSDKALKQFMDYANQMGDKLSYSDANTLASLAYVASFDASGADKEADLKLAAEYAAKAAELNPKAYRPLKRSGDVAGMLASGSNSLAAKAPYYIKAIAIIDETGTTPTASDARDLYKGVADYYLSTGDKENAKKYYGKYLEVNPNDAAVQKAYKAL